VHEIAHAADPSCRVIYTDNDPIVLLHARALLASAPGVTAVPADLRDPARLLTDPAVRAVIDFDQPAAVLMVAVLHFVDDAEDPWSVVRAYHRAMAPGSYLVLSHVTGDDSPAGAIHQAAQVYEHASAPGIARSRDQIARFFTGLDIIPPGLTDPCQWRNPRPPRKPHPVLLYAGVGRKPAIRRAAV